MQVVFIVEKTDDEYISYCDELHAIASGASEEEALYNLRLAVERLIEEYGSEMRDKLSRRKALAVEL